MDRNFETQVLCEVNLGLLRKTTPRNVHFLERPSHKNRKYCYLLSTFLLLMGLTELNGLRMGNHNRIQSAWRVLEGRAKYHNGPWVASGASSEREISVREFQTGPHCVG